MVCTPPTGALEEGFKRCMISMLHTVSLKAVFSCKISCPSLPLGAIRHPAANMLDLVPEFRWILQQFDTAGLLLSHKSGLSCYIRRRLSGCSSRKGRKIRRTFSVVQLLEDSILGLIENMVNMTLIRCTVGFYI